MANLSTFLRENTAYIVDRLCLLGGLLFRMAEAVLWFFIAPGIGETAIRLVDPRYRGRDFFNFREEDTLFDVVGRGLENLIEDGPSPGQLLILLVFALVIWTLKDLPISALMKRMFTRRGTEANWQGEPKHYDLFVVQGFLDRAKNARRTSNIILVLMVGTLIVGMWVFVTAPGVENTRNAAVRRAADQISLANAELFDLLAKLKEPIDKKQLSAVAENVQEIAPVGTPYEEVARRIEGVLSNDRQEYFERIAAVSTVIGETGTSVARAISEQKIEPINSQSTLTRLGSVVILLVALRVLSGLYRANNLLSQQYSAAADAILLALHRDEKTLDSEAILRTIKQIAPTPEPADTISTPLDLVSKLTEKLSDLTSRAAELVKNLKAGGA